MSTSRRILAIALVSAVVQAGCSGQGHDGAHGDGYELAHQLVAMDVAAGGTSADDLPDPALLAAADPDVAAECELLTAVDEYGFETTTLDCGGGDGESIPAAVGIPGPTEQNRSPFVPPDPQASAAGQEPADLLGSADALPLDTYRVLVSDRLVPLLDQDLGAELIGLADHLDRLDAGCGVDLDRWATDLDAYAGAASAVVESLTPERLGSVAGSIDANVAARALVERALFQSGCAAEEPRPVTVDDAERDRLLQLTAAAAHATVALDNALRNSSYGPLFHLFSTLPNYQWLRSHPTSVDVMVLGTSQAGAGVGIKAMNEQLDAEVGSVWVPGALAEVQTLWVDEVLAYADPEVFVWFLGPLDLFAECDTSLRGAEFQRLANARAATFSRGFVVGADPIDRILGPPETVETVRGDGIKREGFDQDGTDDHRAKYVPAFEAGLFCHDRAAIVQDLVARLDDAGHGVIVVGMPVHPELRAARSDQTEMMTMFEREYLEAARFVDLTESMDEPSAWSDFTHLTGDGADDFTDLVIDRLKDEGL